MWPLELRSIDNETSILTNLELRLPLTLGETDLGVVVIWHHFFHPRNSENWRLGLVVLFLFNVQYLASVHILFMLPLPLVHAKQFYLFSHLKISIYPHCMHVKDGLSKPREPPLGSQLVAKNGIVYLFGPYSHLMWFFIDLQDMFWIFHIKQLSSEWIPVNVMYGLYWLSHTRVKCNI